MANGMTTPPKQDVYAFVKNMSSVPFLPPLRPASYIPPLPAPITSSLRRPSSFCFRPDARGPAETHALGSLHSRRRLGLSPLEVPPPANLRCELRRASLGSKGAPPSPAIARTHMRRCACGGQPPTAQRMRLPSSRTQLQPCLTSCTPHTVRRVVWRTHSGSPLVARGGRGGTGGGRHAFSSQRPHGRRFSSGTACPHTASQLHMAHAATSLATPCCTHRLDARA